MRLKSVEIKLNVYKLFPLLLTLQECIRINDIFVSEFYKFVRAKHKERFSGICQQLTGQPAENKEDNSGSKKRALADENLSTGAKKQKTFDPVSNGGGK